MSPIRAALASLLTRDPTLVLDLLRHHLDEPFRPSRMRAVDPARAGRASEAVDVGPVSGFESELLWLVTSDRVRTPEWLLVVQQPERAELVCPERFAAAEARAREALGCRVQTLMIARRLELSRATRRWPRGPVVLDPERVPRVRSFACAERRPSLAALSALVHGREDPRVLGVARSVFDASPQPVASQWTAGLDAVYPAASFGRERGGALRVKGRGS